MRAGEIYALIDREIAPFSLAESWDNSGLLCGDPEARVQRALVCLDITPGAIAQARAMGAQLIISHHPVIFTPLKSVLAGHPVYQLIQCGIAAICAHTNLDMAVGGVNDCLARALGLREVEGLGGEEDVPAALGRIGSLEEPLGAAGLARLVGRALAPGGGVRYVDGGEIIRRVAVCGGAGGSLCGKARALGAQAIVTSEIKHNVYLECAQMGLTAIDAGHFDTERVVLAPLAERLARLAPEVSFALHEGEGPVRLA